MLKPAAHIDAQWVGYYLYVMFCGYISHSSCSFIFIKHLLIDRTLIHTLFQYLWCDKAVKLGFKRTMYAVRTIFNTVHVDTISVYRRSRLARQSWVRTPFKSSLCFFEQETLPSLLSTGWFQKWIYQKDITASIRLYCIWVVKVWCEQFETKYVNTHFLCKHM